jgi:hypothetical protein
MLYIINQRNHQELAYRGGQEPILHLEADLRTSVSWAEENNKAWAFTLSNAGASYFEDRNDLSKLNEIDWEAVHATRWGGEGISPTIKEGKQAEFLVEECFPWSLIERIGVSAQGIYTQVNTVLSNTVHQPRIEIKKEWYY